MGLNCEISSGRSTLGISTIKVLFSVGSIVFQSKTPLTKLQIVLPMLSH